MKNLVYLFPFLILALVALADGEWYKKDHPDILEPFQESIGVGSASSQAYREGDVYVNRVSGAKVFYASRYTALPDLVSASDWLKKPSIIYGVTDTVEQWWCVEDNPLRYVPLAGSSSLISPTEIISSTITANYFTTNILNVTQIIIQGTPFATPTPQATVTPFQTATPASTATPIPPVATVTPFQTATPQPTATEVSTPTPANTPTPVVTPTPWFIQGAGAVTATPKSATEWVINVNEYPTALPTPTPAATVTPFQTATPANTPTPAATPTPPNALATQVAQLEIQNVTSTTTIYQNLGNGLWGVEESFDSLQDYWRVDLPAGKMLVEQSRGTSFVLMDGLSVWPERRIIYGPGMTQAALWFPFYGMGGASHGYGHLQLEDFAGYPMAESDMMTTAITAVMEAPVGSVVTW